MDDVAIAPLPVDAKLPPALDVAAMTDAHVGLESPTSTEQITPMDAVAMEMDKAKDAAVAPTSKAEVAAVVEGLGELKIETIDAPEPASSKVSAMVDEIKTLLNSPTKIPSLSKPDKPSMIPPPSPLATTTIAHVQSTKGSPSPFAHLKRKSMSPTQKDALAARLYTKAMELKHKRDELSTQAPEECTFKPNTSKPHIKHTSLDAPLSSGPSSVTSNGSDKDRFNMLHDQAKELARRKEAQKQSAQAEYSFKPEISKKSRRMSLKLRLRKARKDDDTTTIASPRSVDGKTARRHEELYAQHVELAARRKQKQLEMEAKTAEECTFQPKIKKLKGKSPAKSRPLYDAERERLKRLEKEAKKKQFEMAECTFRPAVQRTKSASTEAKADDKSFFDRMQESERKKEDRLEALRKEQEERKLKEATFRPKIIETKSSKALADEKPFHERLFDKEYLLQQQADRERKKLEQESFSFKPSIESSLVSIPERHGSIFERLHDEGLKKMEQLSLAEQQRLKREMEECTFRPQVSIELKEPPTEPVWERLSNDKKHILEERQRLKEENEAKGCTFKPDLGMSSRSPSRRNTTLLPPSTPAPETTSPNVSPPTSIARQLRRQTSPQLDLPATALVDAAAVLTTDNEVTATTLPPAAPSLVPPFPPVVGDEVSEQSRSILDNYDSWAATLEEKMRELK